MSNGSFPLLVSLRCGPPYRCGGLPAPRTWRDSLNIVDIAAILTLYADAGRVALDYTHTRRLPTPC